MIEISTGDDVDQLLARVAARPDRFRNLVLCSPFIDSLTLARVTELSNAAIAAGCRTRFITSAHAAGIYQLEHTKPGSIPRGILTVSRRLHAKIYLAVARKVNDSEAIVTSANLTCAGIRSNIELGIRARPDCEKGRRLIAQVRHFISELKA